MLIFIKNICINYQSIFSFGYLSTLWLLQKREGRQPELWSPRHLDEYDTYYIWFIAYLGILYIHLLIYFQNSNNPLAYYFQTLSFSVRIQHNIRWGPGTKGKMGEIGGVKYTLCELRTFISSSDLAAKYMNLRIKSNKYCYNIKQNWYIDSVKQKIDSNRNISLLLYSERWFILELVLGA